MYIYQGVEFVVGLSTILITLAGSYSDMIVFAVFYGFCDGCFITTLNVILLTSVEESKRPASLGWNMQVASIFMGSGPPIAGKRYRQVILCKSCCAHAGEGAVASMQCARLRISGACSSPGRRHYVVFLGNALNCHSPSLHPGVQMGTGEFNAGGNPTMD